MNRLRPFVFLLAAVGALALGCGSYPFPPPPETGGASGTGGTGGTGGSTSGSGGGGGLPCDVLDHASLPCVSAHSTVRVVVSGYTGPLYQVCKGSYSPGPGSCSGESLDIGVVAGYADSAAQDAFCPPGSGCVVTTIYDQTMHDNNLEPAPPGGQKPSPGNPARADQLKITANGHTVYGLKFRPGEGYRKLFGNATAVGDEPQTMYMVSSSKDTINGCCFDYGNAETSAHDDGNGTMEAVYVGNGVVWGSGVGAGPWVMADLENGLYPGWQGTWDGITTNTSLTTDYVTGIVIGDTADKNGGKGRFAIYAGDAATGPVTEMWDGIRPEKPGYVPMQKQGSIILSIGGDNSDGDGGRFYEGVMANGVASRETVDALQVSIVAAGYGK